MEAPPAPAPGFVGCTSRKSPPLPKSRASSGCPKGKVPESHTQLCDSIARFFLPAQRGGPKRWLSWRERTPAGVASSGAVLPSMSLPLSPSLFSPCSESQSASDPTAAPPPMACLAGYLGRDTCRIRTAAWEARGPAADWSFVRLTGFRSSIRVMELWGVQSCIGACFARCFPRSLACARGHGTQQQTATSKPKPKKPCKAHREANNYGASSGREGGRRKKKYRKLLRLLSPTLTTHENQSMTSRRRALRQFIPRENPAESIEITARQQRGPGAPACAPALFRGQTAGVSGVTPCLFLESWELQVRKQYDIDRYRPTSGSETVIARSKTCVMSAGFARAES